MEYLGIFGFISFIYAITLQGRVSKLERQMRESGLGNFSSNENLGESLEKRIGKQVKFDFYEDEIDVELIGSVNIEIKDVDEKWVLVHCDNKKKVFDKLIRISSIKGIKEV